MGPAQGKRRRRDGGTEAGAAVVAMVDDLLRRGLDARASDMHFEPTGDGLVVKFRLDGSLATVDRLAAGVAENVVSRLKVLAGLLTYRNDIPQEGRLAGREAFASAVTDLRLAVFPTVHGQRAVVRAFYQERDLTVLERLGLPEEIHAKLRQIAGRNQGVLLMTGPAGSGKSTTLASLLRHIQQRFPGKSIVALEDPVERHIEGVTQVQISAQGAMTFPVALRSLLRQDPEVLMIGEIRDAETARIAVEAGLTGHLVMTTMHSGSPAGALLRLLEMGVEPYLVTSSVHAVLNQRLVRRLCDTCKQQVPAAAGGRMRAAGCEACFQTGYRGRTLIAEIIEMDGALRQAVLDKTDLEQVEQLLRRGGHKTIRQNGLPLVEQGVTTQDELDRVCGCMEGGEA